MLTPKTKPMREYGPGLPLVAISYTNMTITTTASTFAATLELVREGALEIRQQEPFAPIYMRLGPKSVEEAGNLP